MSEPLTQPPGQSLNISGSVLETVQIGGIAGRDLKLTQVQGGVETMNVFGTVQVEQASIDAASPLSQQEYRWRRVLLDKVKQFWIEGVLKKSLHTKVLFELGLEERSNLIQKPLSDIEEFDSDEGQVLPEGTTASRVFEDIGAGRTLLILGEPGAGKTVTLLKLAESLITRSENDLSQPLPVVMNLSSWARKRQSIADWLVQELNNVYGATKSLGKTWIEQEQLILLLDGLDEVDIRYRGNCVKAINQFIQNRGLTELVVCSRIKDYEKLTERLELRSAIYVQPLTLEQINQYLEQAGEQLVALKTALNYNAEIKKLASSPLFLSVMSLAYQDCSLDEFPQLDVAEASYHRLFDAYINRMFQRRKTTHQYPDEQAKRWLIWIAQQMAQASLSMFQIERLQSSCLQTWDHIVYYMLLFGLMGGVLLGLFFGFWSATTYGFWSATTYGWTIWVFSWVFFGGMFGGMFGVLFGGIYFAGLFSGGSVRWLVYYMLLCALRGGAALGAALWVFVGDYLWVD